MANMRHEGVDKPASPSDTRAPNSTDKPQPSENLKKQGDKLQDAVDKAAKRAPDDKR
jgi:hypothetical protein